MACMSIFTGFFVVNQTKNFAVVNGLVNDKFLSMVASVGALFNTCRFMWSWALDHYSYKVVYGILLAA